MNPGPAGALLPMAILAQACRWNWHMHDEEDDAPPFGIVLLLDAPRVAAVDALAESFSRATGRAVSPVIPDNPRAVQAGQLPAGRCCRGRATHLRCACRRHDVPGAFGGQAVFWGYRGGGQQHGEWISVELLHEEAISPENYRIVGKVAADLLGPDCLLLFHPESGGLMLPGPDTTAQLRGDKPLESVFGAASPEVPVVCG